jgi:hypothetical protein
MWLLATLISSLATASAVDSSAIRCLEKFVSQYESSSGYTTKMKKTEFEFGSALTENIEITERKGQSTQLKFIDAGKSGIRNNGMTVSHSGGKQVRIEFGHSKGMGIFLNALAETFTIKSRDLYNSDVTEKQIFTVDRSGFGYLAKVLRKNLEGLRQGRMGDLSDSGKCSIRFSRKEEAEQFQLSKDSNIQEIEENYGTLAYLIYKDNAEKFKSFDSFLNSKQNVPIRISKHFSDFILQLDRNFSPSHFELIFKGKTIGSYDFKDTDYF